MEAVQEEESRGRLWDCSMQEYLSERDRWSSSTLGRMVDLDDGGPRVAWLMQTGKLRSESTRSQTKGSVGHVAIWEGSEVFRARYVVANRNTKKGKEAAEQAEAEGKIVITQAVYDEAMAAAEGVLNAAMERADDDDPFLADFLAAPGLREQSFTWEDSETGLPLKGRADKLLVKAPLIGDLKFTKDWRPDERGWAREAVKYGCHRQAWMYSSAYHAIFGKWPRFIFIVVHNKPPYQVGVYQLPKEALYLGRDQCRKAMRMVLDCYQTGKWFEPCERGIVEVQLPPWAYQDERMEWSR